MKHPALRGSLPGKTAGAGTARAQRKFGRDEVTHLAFLNWRADGCPPGRDQQYLLEAKSQLEATWHLLAATDAAAAPGARETTPRKKLDRQFDD